MGSSGKQDKKRKSDAATSSPSTAVLSDIVSQADKLKKKKVKPTADAPPASLGDALKDQMRKHQTKKKPAAEPAAPASWENNESAPFPRGGGSALTPLEHKAVVAAAREEALFEEPDQAANGNGGADGINVDASAAATAAGGGAELVRAHSLRRKALVGGVRALCAVSDVSSERLIVQLPSRLLGKVDREEVSDELYALASQENGPPLPDLRKLFTVGEVLCCAVLPAARAGSVSTARESRKGRGAPPVELTLRLSIVQRATLTASPRLRAGHLLWATVKSAEEYGWVMDTGTQSGGFMHRSKWHGSGEPARWRPHLMSMVSSILQQPRKPLQLASVGGSQVPRPMTQETAYKFEGLTAGMLVEAQVSGILGDGLRLVFLGYFEATVGMDALGSPSPDWAKRFPRGHKMSARVLFVDPATKAVGISLAPHLVGCAAFSPPLPLGAPLQTEVKQIMGSNGAIVAAVGSLGDDEEEGEGGGAVRVGGWLSRTNIADLAQRQTADDALKALRVGAKAAGVVANYHYLDGLLDVSTRKSAASEERLVQADLSVGQVVKGKVTRIEAGKGLKLRIGKGVYGSVNLTNLSEQQLQRPLDKFSKGQSVKALVLESEPARKKLVLSVKPTLVSSSLERIGSYAAATRGITTHGSVQKVSPKSILIELCGGVRGIVRGSELKAKFGALWEEDPSSCYREGQVVECTVLDCKPKEKRLTLTLLSKEEAASKPAGKLLKAGAGAADQDEAERPKKKRRKSKDDDEATGAAEEAAEADGFRRILTVDEALPGVLCMADPVALGDHGQILCRLDKKGTLLGRVHITGLADPGVKAQLPSQLPQGPLRCAIVGKRDESSGGGAAKAAGSSKALAHLELSIRPSETGGGGSGIVPRLEMSEIAVGQMHEGWIREVSADGLWVSLSPKVLGRVEVLDAVDNPKHMVALGKHFAVGDAVSATVTRVRKDELSGQTKLDLTLRSSHHVRVAVEEAAAKASGKKAKAKAEAVAKAAEKAAEAGPAVGSVVPVRVIKVRAGRGLDVSLGGSLYGRAHMTEVCDDWVQEPLGTFQVGSFTKAVVLGYSGGDGGGQRFVDVSLRAAAVSAAEKAAKGGKAKDAHARVTSATEVEAGELVRGYVKAISGSGCFVSLSRSVDGFVGVRHVSDDFIQADDLPKLLPVGTLVVARAIPPKEGKGGKGKGKGAEGGGGRAGASLPLSLRRSDVEGGAYVPVEDSLSFDDVKPGSILPGKVKSIQDFGIFVRLDGSSLDALCHVSEVSDKKLGSIKNAFSVGETVKVVVLRTNEEKRQISASMKRSRLEEFGYDEDEDERMGVEAAKKAAKVAKVEAGDDDDDDDDEEMEEEEEEEDDEDDEDDEESGEEEEEEEGEEEEESEDEGEEVVDKDSDEEQMDDADEEEEADDDDDDDDEEEVADPIAALAAKPAGNTASAALATLTGGLTAQAGGGFVWSDFAAEGSRSGGRAAAGQTAAEAAAVAASSGGGESGGGSLKSKRKRDAMLAAQEEEAVRVREEELADGDAAPRGAEDYERLLLASPNSSYVWLRYMSFQLSLTEIEKARSIGERALKTIELGNLKERFNIWAALLNLERAHGDEQSLGQMTSRALHGADPKAVYMHIASMHERAKSYDLADAAFEVCCKKYRSQIDVWISWMSAQMARGDVSGGKATLQRAVDAMPRSQHADVLSKFAQLEFKFGEAERGRTVFDSILSNFPKRVDIWSIYMDMELRNGDVEPSKRLFERATSLKLSSKKMKFFFTRYLTFAREQGDAELIAHVKEKARAFVESAAAGE